MRDAAIVIPEKILHYVDSHCRQSLRPPTERLVRPEQVEMNDDRLLSTSSVFSTEFLPANRLAQIRNGSGHAILLTILTKALSMMP